MGRSAGSASPSTDDKRILAGEAVLGHFEVQRRRALPYTPGDVVVRPVAGTEPATEIAGFTDRHTAQMGANT